MPNRAKVMQPESAQLPRIKRLIVIAGPSCSGMSTLIAALQRGEMPHLQKKLEINDPLDWAYVHSYELPQLSGMYAEQLVVRYNFLARRSSNGYRYVAGLLRNSDQAAFLTLHVHPEILVQRNWSSLFAATGTFFRKPKSIFQFAKYLRNTINRFFIYRNPRAVLKLYNQWFKYCAACGGHEHWVIDASGEKPGEIQSLANRVE